MPRVWLEFTEDGGPAWADAVVIVPWTMYLCYGDRRILTTGSVDHCLTWVRIYRSTGRALVPGSPLSYNCPL